MSEELSELLKVRREKLDDLRKKGIDPYPYRFERTITARNLLDKYKDISDESKESVKVAGRIMTKRGHGKASFANVQDETGRIQIYGKLDVMGKDKYEIYQKLDMGDIIGVTGKVFRTRTNEITVKVEDFEVLCKSLHPLPEKWHGLTDKELRYRERYVDLIVNHNVKEVFIKRGRIISEVRKFLESRGFLEVETPVLHMQAGGAAAKPFETHHNTLDMPLVLRIALELHLKRLIVGGFEKVFEIGRVFRNEGMSFKHNPEYTMLELYQAYADYNDIMKLTEELVSSVARTVLGTTKVKFKGKDIDFKPPWKRITLHDALEKYAKININVDEKGLRKIAKTKGLEGHDELPVGKIINLLYDKFVEPNIVEPTFIMDYPIETSPLAKKKRDNPKLVERFEVIVCGMEIANAFSELNDPIDQRERFNEQVKARAAGDDEAESMDEDFLRALEYGMPPTGGLGIGIDRIVMFLTGSESIRDVLFFPHMKPVEIRDTEVSKEEMDVLDKKGNKK
ncbi:lysine--tRNA ligase [Candidatus Margulisiibacteriota bacterium]